VIKINLGIDIYMMEEVKVERKILKRKEKGGDWKQQNM